MNSEKQFQGRSFEDVSPPGKAMSLKKFKSLPVHVVDDHNDALRFIYRCIGSRHLPLENNAILHFDSHPDLMVPKGLPADAVGNKAEVLDAVSIESWLMPALYAGHFSTVDWIKPEWSNQIPVGTYEIHVGKRKAEIGVHSDVYYFLSDGVCAGRQELENGRGVTLNVREMSGGEAAREVSSRECWYVLDVDLDFFSTKNPFKEMYERGGLYEKLKPLFSFEVPVELAVDTRAGENIPNEELLLRVSRKRAEQLEELESVFECLERKESIDSIGKDLTAVSLPHLIDVINCAEEFYPDVDWYLVHSAGLTLDATELPHHVSSEEELLLLLRQFEEFLRELEKPPVLVTLARSSTDDYCPPEQVDFIQGHVLDILGRVFGEISVELPREREDGD